MRKTPISDRLLFDAVLSRAAGEAYGAIATLPLVCLGRIEGADGRKKSIEHFTAWAAYVTVARDLVRTLPLEPDRVRSLRALLDDLLAHFAGLRDAFVQLTELHQQRQVDPTSVHQNLVASYEGMLSCLAEIEHAAGLQLTFLGSEHALRHRAHSNSLQWLATEIGATVRPGAASPASAVSA